ncbi:MAG: hypothetical protein J6B54_04320 [Clostridia bacterium]|nr:hypothetical protein [Clostridia bacterium]
MNRYPGVICLTGHSHGGFTGRNNIYVADYASFHVPCLRSDNQGYLVEVYKDYTVFKGMDLWLGDQLDCGTFILPNNFTDRISAYGITLRVTDGGIVYWKANGGDSSWKKLTSLSELKTDGTVQSLRYYEEDTVDFRTNETHLQWKLSIEDDSAWKDLISLEEMPKSPDGSSDSGNSSSSNSDVTSDSGSASTSTDVGSGNVTENSDTNAGNGSSNDGNNDTSNQGIWIWFVIGACAVVLCGGGIAVALILLKKKK